MNEECIICFDETDQFIFFPCTHKVCPQCKELLEQRKCPICNTPFEEEWNQPDQNIVIRRNTINAIESSSRFIVFILISFVVYGVYHFISRSDT